MPGALASWAHDTSAPGEPWTCSRGSARNSTMPWTPEIRRSRASAVAAGGGTDPTATWFPGLTSLTVENSSRRVLLAAASPFSVKCLVSWVASSAAATVKMNSARTTPLTARNAARGSSASRRAAIRVPGRLARRAMTRAAAIVSHGPARIRPIMISAKPGTYTSTLPPGLAGLPCTTPNPSSARPASSGSTRQARSEPGVTRRLTPSGEMFTRRSASRAARADAAGARSPRRCEICLCAIAGRLASSAVKAEEFDLPRHDRCSLQPARSPLPEIACRPGVYLCTKWNTHSRALGLAGDRHRAFSIVRVGNQIAEYLLLSSMRTARLGGIQITLFCRVTQPASHRVAGDRMRDVDDRDDGVGALAL
jgi:hypothetical protein